MVSRIGRGQLSVDAAHHARLRRAAAEFSLRLDQRHNETSTQSGRRRRGYSAARSILSLREPVTAIFVIGVAGFNDTEAALRHPPLTSVAEFPEELGRHLAGFALRRAQEPDREPQKLIIPTRVVVRESTKPMTQRGLTLAEPNVDPPVASEL